MASNLLFKRGLYENLFGNEAKGIQRLSQNDGTIYFTTDEGGMYIDVGSERKRIQGSVLYFDTLADFAKGVKPPYSTDLLYFIAKSEHGDTKEYNALVRWDGSKWVQVNVTAENYAALESIVAGHTTTLNTLSGTVDNHGDRIEALETWRTGTVESALSTLQTNVGTLQTNVGTLQSWKTEAATAIQNNTTNINSLSGRLDGQSDKVTALETWKATAQPAIEGLQTKTGNLETSVSGLQTWKSEAATSISNNTTNISNLTNTVDTIKDETIPGLSERIEVVNDRITTSVEDLENQIAGLTGGSIADLTTRVGNLETTQSQQDSKIDKNTDDIDSLKTRVGANESGISSLNTTVTSHGTSITSLSNSVTNHGTRIGTLETNVGTLTGNLDNLSDLVGAASNIPSTLGTDVTTAIKSLNNSIKTINEKNNAQDQTIATLTPLISDVSGLTTRVSNVETNLSTLSGKVDDLEDDLLKELNEHIVAANAMRFRSDIVVSNATQLAELKTKTFDPPLAIGDTIVISTTFPDNATNPSKYYNAGDLLIIGGEEKEDGTMKTINITHVDSGYGNAHDLILELSEDADTNTPMITLKDAGKNDIGSFKIKGAATSNIVAVADGDVVELSMAWGEF